MLLYVCKREADVDDRSSEIARYIALITHTALLSSHKAMIQYTPWQMQNQSEQRFHDKALKLFRLPGCACNLDSVRDASDCIVPEGCAQSCQASGKDNAENP
jgi:hypothetical protein